MSRRLALIVLLAAAPVHAATCDPFLKWAELAAQDRPAPLTVTDFQVEYVRPLSFLPRVISVAKTLADLEVELRREGDVLHAPRPGSERVRIAVRDLVAMAPVQLDVSALSVIAGALAAHYAALDPPIDLFVAPSPGDVDPHSGADVRAPGRTELLFMIAFEGPVLPVSGFELEYAGGRHPDLPPAAELLNAVEVELTEVEGTMTMWRPHVAPTRMTLADFTAGRQLTAGAVQVALEEISRYFGDRDIVAVYVRPAEGELGSGASDRRGGRETLKVDIIAATVGEQRTLARGDRVDVDDRVDHPEHAWIKERSPFTPGPDGRQALLRKDVLDDYLFRLSRHPGRRVVSAVTPGEEAGTIGLDFEVNENKPLLLYAEVSNTGTSQTDTVRERFGLFHNQLTGNDDILSLEYITAGFDESHAVVSFYEAPFGDAEDLRWRVSGLWSQYDASDVGFATQNFSGDTWSIGGELSWNVFQDRQLFVDLVGGVRYLDVEVDNEFLGLTGSGDFVLPYVGARLERHTDEARTDAFLAFESNLDNLTDVDQSELNRLGRFLPDDSWNVLRWDATQTFFLEPLVNREAWEDVSSAESSTLAHEVMLRFRGQHAFDDRLIPQLQQVAGGFYTVRGYPEAVLAGDTVLIGTAEYRFHLPWSFGYRQELSRDLFGRPFRAIPQQPYGRADWDLILRGFVDIAHVINSDRFFFESDETLIGAGVGLELSFRRNATIRLDWGFVLDGIPDRVNHGSNRLHVVARFFF